MKMASIRIFPDDLTLARAAAEFLVKHAIAAIEERGRFSVALSGGSSPKAVHALLAGDEMADAVDWAGVHVFWGDERSVPADHPESNYRMARETLLDRVPIPPGNVHRMDGGMEPASAADAYAVELTAFFGTTWPVFDLVLLGMGSDGHTASLFPHSAALRETERPVVPVVAQYQGRPANRVTLTVPAINGAKQILFLVTGAAKAEIVRAVLEGPGGRFPAQQIRPIHGQCTWFIDSLAASKMRFVEKDAA